MALLKSTDEIVEFLPASVSADYDRIKPFLDVAEDRFLKKLFGNAFWDEITAQNDNPQDGKVVLDQVIGMSKRAEIHLAYFKGFDALNVKIDDSGFHRTEDDNTRSLFNYQEKNLKEYFQTTGLNTLDVILEYMEDNIDIDDMSTWKESDACTQYRRYFINSAKEFHEQYDIDKSRLVFLNLVPYMKYVEDREIEPLIGPPLFDKMKSLIKNGTIDDGSNEPYNNLLSRIQETVAPYTVLYAIGNLGMHFSDRGALFSDFMVAGENIEKESYDSNRAQEVKEFVKDKIAHYVGRLSSYLLSNKDSLPEYEEFIGDDYEPYEPSFDNTDKKIHRL